MQQPDENNRTQQNTNENGESSHIREVTKKKPVSKRNILLTVVLFVVLAIAAGIIAACVFVKFLPTAEKIFHKDEPSSIVIPKEDPVSESSETLSVSEPESEVSSSSEETAEPGSTAETSSEPVIVEPRELEVSDYTTMMHKMMAVADKTQTAVVDVAGIDSWMDYFDKARESRKNSAGLIIAGNEAEIFILTAHEAINDVNDIVVTFYDNATAPAQIRKHDANTGLAVITVNMEDIPNETLQRYSVANLGSTYNVKRGDPVMALGRPLGYPGSVAFGNVTAITGTVSTLDMDYSLFFTDIPSSDAGSGILIDAQGEVVGIIARKYAPAGSTTVAAVGITALKSLMEDLSNNVARPYMGIKGSEVTAVLSSLTDIPMGVLVTEVAADSPAMLSGIKEFDIILSIADEETGNMTRFKECLMHHKPGETVRVKALRQGADGYAEVEFTVELGEI